MGSSKEMSGAQKAAAFLMSLDKEAAANVIKNIDEKVIVEVVEAMAKLEAVAPPAGRQETPTRT